MARIRHIRPEFWWDATIDDLTDDEALAFIALWNMVDDEGRHKHNPRELAMKCPRTSLKGNWAKYLKTFGKHRLIIKYDVNGCDYFYVRTWHRHQRINRPTLSSIPNPPDGDPIAEAVKRAKKSTVSKDEGIPYEDIYKLWNKILGKSLPNVQFDWKDSVLVVVRSAWLAYPERQNLDWWKEYFRFFLKSDFLMGRSNLKFSAQLRWVCLPDNMEKIQAGTYTTHDKKKQSIDRFKKGDKE